MPTNLDLPTLDRLHAEASRTPWVATGIELSSVIDPATPSREQLEKNAAFIAAIVNAFPSLSARVRELEADLSRVLKDGNAHTDRDESRIRLLEETLRGILQEKQKQRDLMQSGAIDKAGTKAGEAYEWAKGEIEREIAWLEQVLRGEK
jgi:hypothetical protein